MTSASRPLRRTLPCALFAFAAASCGPSDSIDVRVFPAEISLVPNEVMQFEASVSGTAGRDVEWELELLDDAEILGNGALGTIDSEEGLYQAPARVPPDWANLVRVRAYSIANPSSYADALVTIEPAPVFPARGPTYGGTELQIGGEGFNGQTIVYFDGIPALSVYFDSPVLVWAETPEHEVGVVDVRVHTPGEEDILYPGAFTYGAGVVSFDGGQVIRACEKPGRPSYAASFAQEQMLAIPCEGEGRTALLFGEASGRFFADLPAYVATAGSGASVEFASFSPGAGSELAIVRDGGVDVFALGEFEQLDLVDAIGVAGVHGATTARSASVDLDGDGAKDLVWIDRDVAALFVSMQGVGGLSPAVAHPVGGTPRDLAIGDLDGDGFLDIAVARALDAALFLNTAGTGVLSAGPAVPGLDPVDALVAADVDGDADADLLFGSANDPSAFLLFAESDGMGTFAAGVAIASDGPVGSLTAEYLDGDVFADLLSPSEDGTLRRWSGSAAGPSAPVHSPATAGDARTALVADLDTGVAGVDLVLGYPDRVEVHHGAGGTAGWPRVPLDGVPGRTAIRLTAGGASELLVPLSGGGGGGNELARVALSPAALTDSFALPAGAANLRVIAADVDGDLLEDAIVSDCGPVGADRGSVCVAHGTSGGLDPTLTLIPAPWRVADVVATDLDADGWLDLVLALSDVGASGERAGGVAIIAGSPSGFLEAELLPLDFIPSRITAADEDLSGSDDLFLTDTATGRVMLASVYPDGGDAFESVDVEDAEDLLYGISISELIAVDLDADYHLDLVVLREPVAGTGSIGVLRGYDFGFTEFPIWQSFTGRGASIAHGDVDGDTLPDVLVTIAAPSPSVAVLRGLGEGALADPLHYVAGVDPAAILTRDLDGDGLAEALIADRAGSAVILGNESY